MARPILIRAAAAVALAAALAGLPAGIAAAAPQGCVASSPPSPAFPNPCTFEAGDDGLYVARGDWSLRIERGGEVVVLSGEAGDPSQGAPGTVRRGDVVTARALTPGSSVLVGNPSPLAADPPPGAPAVPAHTREAGRTVPSADGTPIVFDLLLPTGATASAPVPAVVLAHGFGSHRGGWDPALSSRTRALLGAGYAVLTYDARGFGQSGGRAELNGPGEVADVRALVDALAADPRIATDGPGDPRVGMSGESMGGAIQLLAAARDPRIDAIAPEFAWHDLLGSLLPGGVYRSGWVNLLSAGGLSSGKVHPLIPRAAAEGTATGDWSPEVRGFFAARGMGPALGAVRAPTLLLQGLTDTLFGPAEGVATYLALRDRVPAKLALVCGGHGTCKPYEPATLAAAAAQRDALVLRWMARWLRGDTGVDTGAPVELATQDGGSVAAAGWPVGGTTGHRAAGRGVVAVNGEPAAGGGAEPPVPRLALPVGATTPLGQQPRAAATSLKVPLGLAAGTVAGAPRVRLDATALGGAADAGHHVTLFLRLVDLDSGEVVGNQETPAVLPADGRRAVTEVALEPMAWRVRPRDRLALEVVSTSANWEPYRGAALATLHHVEVTVPVLP